MKNAEHLAIPPGIAGNQSGTVIAILKVMKVTIATHYACIATVKEDNEI